MVLQPKGMQLFLGLTDIEKEDRWRWQSSGSRAKFTKFQPGEPDGDTSENCVIIGNGHWADVSCSTKLKFHVCERPSEKKIPIGNKEQFKL